MIYILVPRNVFNIHSIVNSLVSCNVGKIPETWSVRRLKYIYIYTHKITYLSHINILQLVFWSARDMDTRHFTNHGNHKKHQKTSTISAVLAVSPASGASSVMPDRAEIMRVFEQNQVEPGPRFCRASTQVPLTPMLGTRQKQAELKAIGIPKGTWI